MVSPELLAAAMHGDQWAVARLFVALRPMVYRYCRARLGHGRILTTPDDVAQDVLLAILTALPRYQIRHGSSFRAYALAVAAHKVVDAQRAALRNRIDVFAQPPDWPGPVDNPPEQHALAAEQAARLSRLLQTLTAQRRAILTLRIVVGLSADDTARAVGVSAVAVRVAQHRALRQLRSQLANRADRRLPFPGAEPARSSSVSSPGKPGGLLPRVSRRVALVAGAGWVPHRLSHDRMPVFQPARLSLRARR